MRDDVLPYNTVGIKRDVEVWLYPKTTTLQELILGTAVGGTDIYGYVDTCTHTSKVADIDLVWNQALAALQPKPGMLVQIVVNGRVSFNAVVWEVGPYVESRDEKRRMLSITARTRDATGPWRNTRVTSDVYPTGSRISGIIEDVIKGFGVTDDEIDMPVIGHYVPHTNAQMADMTPWEILTIAGIPGGVQPFINAIGQFTAFDKDVTRAADIVIDANDLKRVAAGPESTPTTAVRLYWLDKDLWKVTQQDQVVGEMSLTAGFFKQHQEKDIYFSQDRTQRAESTYMAVKQSINDGLLPVGGESYTQIDPLHGVIEQDVDTWVAGLAGASIAVLIADALIPDGVVSLFGGSTIPIGRVVHNSAQVAMLLIMMSLGTGIYEVRGRPYDFVNATNKTEAYDENQPEHLQRRIEIKNDFIYDREHARQVATRELLYAHASAVPWDIVITDDPRIEPGDILGLPDTSRIYVEDYKRDLTRGSAAELAINGFRV